MKFFTLKDFKKIFINLCYKMKKHLLKTNFLFNVILFVPGGNPDNSNLKEYIEASPLGQIKIRLKVAFKEFFIDIKDTFIRLFNYLQEIYEEIKELFELVFKEYFLTEIKADFDYFYKTLNEIFEDLCEIINLGYWSFTGHIATIIILFFAWLCYSGHSPSISWLDFIINAIKTLGGMIKPKDGSPFGGFGQTILNVFSDMVIIVKDICDNVFEVVIGCVGGIIEGLAENIWDSLKGILKGILDWVIEILACLYPDEIKWKLPKGEPEEKILFDPKETLYNFNNFIQEIMSFFNFNLCQRADKLVPDSVSINDFLLKDYQTAFPTAGSREAALIMSFYSKIEGLTAVIVTLVFLLLTICIFKFSRKRHAVPLRFAENHKLEAAWTLAPLLVVIFITVFSTELLFELNTSELNSKIMYLGLEAQQWAWTVVYFGEYLKNFVIPESSLESDEAADLNFELTLPHDITLKTGDFYDRFDVDFAIALPLDSEVHLMVTSNDVLHSAGSTALGFKADAVPGRVNEVIIHPTAPGVYWGTCYELCGPGHAYMPMKFVVLDSIKDIPRDSIKDSL